MVWPAGVSAIAPSYMAAPVSGSCHSLETEPMMRRLSSPAAWCERIVIGRLPSAICAWARVTALPMASLV